MTPFLDTNVLIYAFEADQKTPTALELLERGGTISVQSLNEFTAVARRKLGLSFGEIESAIDAILVLCGSPVPVTYAIHSAGRAFAERYKLAIYDSMLVATAIEAGCDTLYSEDMQAGLVIDGRLRIVNPFAPAN